MSEPHAVPKVPNEMADHQLAGQLARVVMGWRVYPSRIAKDGRTWIPRWRFRPFRELADAFQLLDRAADSYTLSANSAQCFVAEVRIGERVGHASGTEKARVISTAVARALGLEV
jgi:hypothetical protein